MKQILLTQGENAIVDDGDYESLCCYKWRVRPGRYCLYAMRDTPRIGGRKNTVSMHREIMGLERGDLKLIDHIDGDGLNNQRFNLRVCNNSQNLQSQAKRRGGSQYKGVSWTQREQKWRSAIKVNGRRLHLGYFDNESKAAMAYDRAAKEHFGEFARLNSPGEAAIFYEEVRQ